jgi:cytidylate kinase
MSNSYSTTPLLIAIDGHSSCGKSTLAKDLAKALSIYYLDSGAMYRAVTLYCIKNRIDINQINELKHALDNITISIECINDVYITFLNGQNVETKIRSSKVAALVSDVAKIPIVRESMVKLQREFSQRKSVVMDGRDIGTVVFPHANFKFFLTADPEIRMERRFKELVDKGIVTTREEVMQNILKRDHIDSTRAHSPLKVAEDAIIIDNSHINRQEQLEIALQHIQVKK